MRTISRTNEDGSKVTYVQLAHNVRDEKTQVAKAKVVHTFGRTDSLDVDALKRLAKSICRFLSPEDVLDIQGTLGGGPPLKFVRSTPIGPWGQIFTACCPNSDLFTSEGKKRE